MQGERLAELLVALKNDGVPASDIVILGRYRLENSVIGNTDIRFPWKIAAATAEGLAASTVAYSTIHAFKGMEAPIVIMVDVDDLSEGEGESLLYVGMSRARLRLYMFIAAQCRAEFDRKVSEGLKELIGA
jgi:superfamily I DNA/RNA helicase